MQLHISTDTASVSAPHLGRVQLPAQLAQQCALISQQLEISEDGTSVSLPMPAISERQLSAWLAFTSEGSALPPEAAAKLTRLRKRKRGEAASLMSDELLRVGDVADVRHVCIVCSFV